MAKNDDFQPDWISAPGDTMADILKERDLSLVDFAQQMGQTAKYADELIQGSATITIEIAQRLERILGGTAKFWTVRESQYRDDIARLQREAQRADAGWLREIPVKDMINFGWLQPVPRSADMAVACLRFFNVPNVKAWRWTYSRVLDAVAFRTSASFDSELGAVAAWLRKGEIESESIECRTWNGKRFEETLSSIRPLTRKKQPSFFLPELQKRCAECGVAAVIARAPTGCRASGATRFISENKALLLLSFRYLSDDHFWFTFFHEAAHLLLHSKEALFLEGAKMPSTKEEEEANEFAANILVPPEFRPAMLNLAGCGKSSISHEFVHSG